MDKKDYWTDFFHDCMGKFIFALKKGTFFDVFFS